MSSTHIHSRVSHERILMELAEVNALLVLLVRLLLGDNASPLLAQIAKVNKIRYSTHSLPRKGAAGPLAAPPASPDEGNEADMQDAVSVGPNFTWLSPPGPPLMLDGDNKEN